MAEVINMPRLSDTMEEGTVAKWHKKEGDKVEEGDILAEIETDKATMEFESFYEGTLLYIGLKEGESAAVDHILAIIGEEGEDIDSLIKEKSDDSSKEDSSTSDKNSKDNEAEEKSEDKDNNDSDSGAVDDIPDDVEVITMPRLSDTMEEGTISTWVKKEGDQVEEGDILAEIETDKATMEFESFYSGTLLKVLIEEDKGVPVESPIAIIGSEDADVSKVLESLKTNGKKEEEKNKDYKKSEKKLTDDQEESAKDTPQKKSSKSTSPKKQNTKKQGGRILASPLAKKMAADKGIDIADVEGSGDNGRIIKRDIESYKPSEKSEVVSRAESHIQAGEEGFEEIKNSQMRKTIAKRLAESKFNAPHYYLTIEVDMENAMQSRKAINDMPDTKISYNDLVIKASAMALRKHPRVNSQWTQDTTKIAKHIHIGAAVAVEDGLVVPVLQFADQLSLNQISAQVKDYAQKARNKKLQPDEMEGSTFTVSNLGMFGIEDFTSIINQPNSAILSVGMIKEKPVVKDGEIVVGHMMKLTLACDHRTVDGATGSKFLATLKTYLENPVVMLA